MAERNTTGYAKHDIPSRDREEVNSKGERGEKCWMARGIDRFYGKQNVRDHHQVIVGLLVFE